MLAAPSVTAPASPAIGRRPVGRCSDTLPLGLSRPYAPPQGNVMHQARPFLANVNTSCKQIGMRRVGSPPKDAVQRQAGTRRVGSPPPPPRKSGSPSPPPKRSSHSAQEETKSSNGVKESSSLQTSVSDVADDARRNAASIYEPRPQIQSSRTPIQGTGGVGARSLPGVLSPPANGFTRPVGDAAPQLSVESNTRGEQVKVAAEVQQSLAMGAGLPFEDKLGSCDLEKTDEQRCTEDAMPHDIIARTHHNVKGNSEQVHSDTASTASQENAQNDTTSVSSQDVGPSAELATGSMIRFTCPDGADISSEDAPAGREMQHEELANTCLNGTSHSCKQQVAPAAKPGLQQRVPSYEPIESTVNSSSVLIWVGKEHKEGGVGAADSFASVADESKKASNGGAVSPRAPRVLAAADISAATADESKKASNGGAASPRAPRVLAAADISPATADESKKASNGGAASPRAPRMLTAADSSAATVDESKKAINGGAASPRVPRCLTRTPLQQRVLRSRSPPTTERSQERNSRGSDQMQGLTRMSQGGLEAFAAECQNVCSTYEKNLHELQLLCSAIDRTAQSPRGGASRQSNAGTPDSSCRPSCRGTVRTQRTSGGSKSSTPEQSWRLLHESKKSFTPERNWRTTAGRKDAGTPERSWRATNGRKDSGTPERSMRAPCLNQGSDSSRGLRGTDMATQERTPRPTTASKNSATSVGLKVPIRTPGFQGIPRTDANAAVVGQTVKDESVVQALFSKGFLTHTPAGWMSDPVGVPDDLAHVRTMFSAQVPEAMVLGVYRVKHDGHNILYSAVQGTMEAKTECVLWHGTSTDCVRNIALNGFNRNYCGRHGMKLGYGTYFSSSADYSVRFCDRRGAKRVMFLAKVLVGKWTKGSQEMKEPPVRDDEGMTRYDSTVDNVDSPNIYCVFRDYQAVPLYLIEFTGPS